jgi:formyltetrahydrofolate synthetase
LSVGLFCVVIGLIGSMSMAPESVSFRITRTAEDLAQTVAALSHRLVHLEQRLGLLEMALEDDQQPQSDQLQALSNVEVLLRDCRQLLETSAPMSAPVALKPDPPQELDLAA